MKREREEGLGVMVASRVVGWYLAFFGGNEWVSRFFSSYIFYFNYETILYGTTIFLALLNDDYHKISLSMAPLCF